jgi:Na+/H+-dicarboxylate symporter
LYRRFDVVVFVVLFMLVFGAFVLGVVHGFEWVSPRISLREIWMDVLCIFVIDLVPSNAGKPLRFKDFWLEL